MKIKLKKNYLFVIVFIATIIYLIISIKDGLYSEIMEVGNSTITKLSSFGDIAVLNDSLNNVLVSIIGYTNSTWLSFWNLKTNKLNERHYPNETYAKTENFITDKENSTIYFATTKGDLRYYLHSVKLENNNVIDVRDYFLMKHPLFDIATDSTITINGVTFLFPIFKENLDSIYIKEYKHGYKIVADRKDINKLSYFPPDLSDLTDIHKKISTIIEEKFQKKFTKIDVSKIYHHFLIFQFYNNYLKEGDELKIAKMYSPHNIGMVDCNGDGYKEIITVIYGHRFYNSYLLCYDVKNRKLLWKREFAGYDYKPSIIDIDDDGKKEIIIGNHAPCSQPSFNYYEKKDETGLPYFSYFKVFDTDGNIKEINGKPLLYNMSPDIGFYQVQGIYLEDKKEFLLGLKVFDTYDERSFLKLNIKTNTIDTLDITYNSLEKIFLDGEFIKAINLTRDGTELLTISKDYKIVDKKKISNLNYRFRHDFEIILLGQKYYVLNIPKFTILDKNFDEVFHADYSIFKHVKVDENRLAIIKKEGNELSSLKMLKFHKRYYMKTSGFILLGVELFLLFLYIFIRQITFRPSNKLTKNYLVLYSFFNQLYYWTAYGSFSKIYSFPRKLSRDKNVFNNFLSELSERSETILSKNFIIAKMEVYEVISIEEMEIVKRISHDVKNGSLGLKVYLDNLSKYMKNNNDNKKYSHLLDAIYSKFNLILENSFMLSEFSQLESFLKKEEDLVKVFKEIKIAYIFNSSIKFNIEKGLTSATIQGDKKLLKTAIRNLIDNAIHEVKDSGGDVLFNLNKSEKYYILSIKNKNSKSLDLSRLGTVGYSNKKGGTGLGLVISRKIIEKTGGIFDINTGNGFFIVTISLKKENYEE